jgi:hypothetical protein
MACRREFLGFPVIYFYDINSTSSDRRIYTHPRFARLGIFSFPQVWQAWVTVLAAICGTHVTLASLLWLVCVGCFYKFHNAIIPIIRFHDRLCSDQ